MNTYYSKSNNRFFSLALKPKYEKNSGWPGDAVEITGAEEVKYQLGKAPLGKELGGDAGGRPVWVDIPPPSAAEQAAIDKRLAKQTGELYASTGVTVPFTNEVAVGVMQVEKGFETAEKAVAAGLKTQAYLDALVVNLEISDTVSLELTPATILEFSAWFWTKRGSFF